MSASQGTATDDEWAAGGDACCDHDDVDDWYGKPWRGIVVEAQEDGLGPFAVKRPQVFVAADINLWNVLLFGLERVVNDAVSDTSACQCLIDSTFWLLTKQEQCSEISRALLALLNCAPITRTVLVDGLFLRAFDRVRHTAVNGCCDDPTCDLQSALHQFILAALDELALPLPEVQDRCKELLASDVFVETPFLNFALDALLVNIMGTAARDFQLNLNDDTAAIYDTTLAEMYGAMYFAPPVPTLSSADLTRLDSLGRAFTRCLSHSVAPAASERLRDAYTHPVVFEKTLGERLMRMRSMSALFEKAQKGFPATAWPALPPRGATATAAVVDTAADRGKKHKASSKSGLASSPTAAAVSDEDAKLVRAYWDSLTNHDRKAVLTLTSQQLLESAFYFAPWLTFRLYLRVLMNPLLATPEAAFSMACKLVSDGGIPLGSQLSVFPAMYTNAVTYSSLTADVESAAKLPVLPMEVMQPPAWLFYNENACVEAGRVLSSVCSAASVAAGAGDESSVLLAPASIVMQHMERGLLWLLWAGVVVKARQHFALQEAVAKSERAYALLMAEEEAAASKAKKAGKKGKKKPLSSKGDKSSAVVKVESTGADVGDSDVVDEPLLPVPASGAAAKAFPARKPAVTAPAATAAPAPPAPPPSARPRAAAGTAVDGDAWVLVGKQQTAHGAPSSRRGAGTAGSRAKGVSSPTVQPSTAPLSAHTSVVAPTVAVTVAPAAQTGAVSATVGVPGHVPSPARNPRSASDVVVEAARLPSPMLPPASSLSARATELSALPPAVPPTLPFGHTPAVLTPASGSQASGRSTEPTPPSSSRRRGSLLGAVFDRYDDGDDAVAMAVAVGDLGLPPLEFADDSELPASLLLGGLRLDDDPADAPVPSSLLFHPPPQPGAWSWSVPGVRPPPGFAPSRVPW